MTLKNETKRADEETKERNRLFVSKKGLKVQLKHKLDKSKELETLQYNLVGAIA